MNILELLHHYIVPSHRNGHHPHILRHRVVVCVLAFAILVEFGALAQSLFVFRSDNMIGAVLPGVVASLTNDARVSNNRVPLSVSMLLTKAAQNKADDMVSKGYFSHAGPDGAMPWVWIDGVGYQYEYAGENLAVNFIDSDKLVEAWLASPEHRANILKPSYTEIGIGMATGTYQGREAVFVVQFFALPASKNVVFARADTISPSISPPIATTAAVQSQEISTSSSTATAKALVLGASTQVVDSHKGILRLFDNVRGSPVTYANIVLVSLLVFFTVLFVLGSILGARLPHPSAMVNGLTLAALLFGFVLINKSTMLGPPLDLSSNAPNLMMLQSL